MSVLLLGGLTSCSIKTRVKRADKKYDIGEYYDAAEIYRSVYSRISSKTEKPLKAHVAFRQGECYRILNHQRAVTCFQNAIRYHYPDSIVYLHLAQVQQYQGKYKDAAKNYQIYLEQHCDDYVARAGSMACSQYDTWRKNPGRYKVTAAKEFNQKRTSNFAPAFIGEDGDALMFTSNRSEKTSTRKPNALVLSQGDKHSIYTSRARMPMVNGKISLCQKDSMVTAKVRVREKMGMIVLKTKQVRQNWVCAVLHPMGKPCTSPFRSLSMGKIWGHIYIRPLARAGNGVNPAN